MTDNLPKPQRDARGLWAPGNSGNPSGKPKRLEQITELAQQEAPAAFAKLITLMEHKDGRVALAAANSILDRAYGKPVASVAAKVETLDVGKMWLAAMQMTNGELAKTVEGSATPTHLVKGYAAPVSIDNEREALTPLTPLAPDNEAKASNRGGCRAIDTPHNAPQRREA